MDSYIGDGEETAGAHARWSPPFEDQLRSTGVEGVTDQPPGIDASAGLRGQLRRFPREGARGATEPIHAGRPALLRSGAPSSHPQFHLACHHFVVVCEGYLGVEPHRKLWLHLFKA
jgi:hypothetical protein